MLTLILLLKEKVSFLFALPSANGMTLPAMSFTHCFQSVFVFQQQKGELQ
jgi:hypothetical protein